MTDVRIVDLPDLGPVTDDTSFVAEHAGSGRVMATAVRSYIVSVGTSPPGTAATIAALRSNTDIILTTIYVEAYATPGDKGGGLFVKVATDTTTADNGGTVIVDGGGRRWYRDTGGGALSVRWFGAVADGITDCTPAFQAVINWMMTNQGGELHIPAGRYALAAPVVINIASTSYTGPRVRIHGEGGQASFLICANDGIRYTGAAGNPHTSQLDINGLNMEGPTQAAGSVGLEIVNGSYVTTSDFVISAFDTAISCTDLEVSEFGAGTRIRWNNVGIVAAAGSVTGFNSIAFRGATISNNYVYGAHFTTGVNLILDNTDIQYNGAATQATTSWGLKLTNYGLTNGVGLVAINAYFEGNGGCADLWLDNSAAGPTSINTIVGTLFMRLDAAKYVKNPILVSGSQATNVFLVGCSFASATPYVTNAANQYWSVTNTGLTTNGNLPSNVYDAGSSNLFQSATETPSRFTASYLSSGTLGVGTAPAAGESAAFRPTADEILSVGVPTTVVGAISLSARNDANSAIVPMELRASMFHFIQGTVRNYLPVQMLAGTAPATPPAGWFSLYVDTADSKLKVKGPGGTVTILASA